MNYAKHYSTKSTPQSQPIPGKAQVKNNAGGFVFQVDDFTRLNRFLILGSEGGTYYVKERELTVANADCVLRCMAQDFNRTVDAIVAVSDAGRAPKNDPAVFALALCAGLEETPEKRAYALEALPKVCRIGTHLFQFVDAIKELRGWGTALCRAVSKWYTDKTPDDLAYQLVKYQQRNGVSHRDVARLARIGKQNTPLWRWLVGANDQPRTVKGCEAKGRKERHYEKAVGELPGIVQAFEVAKSANEASTICTLIHSHNLPRECIPTKWLNDLSVWDALLQKMPLTALVRNLGKMSSVGLLSPLSHAVNLVTTKLGDRDYIHKSRLHPMAILMALRTYSQGHGEKGSLSWTAVPQIVDALNEAFYMAFDNVEPTGQSWLLGVDVSGSMSSPIAGSSLSCGEGAVAMALITAHVEKNYVIGAFSDVFKVMNISKGTRLDAAMAEARRINFGRTDCSLPMQVAQQAGWEVQNFMVITDNETWHGSIHPYQALQQYRQYSGIASKLAVVAMSATEFSIADHKDPGMLDVVGFDASTPQVISEFARGNA